jgi:molybdopterin synthase catalytic subunit
MLQIMALCIFISKNSEWHYSKSTKTLNKILNGQHTKLRMQLSFEMYSKNLAKSPALIVQEEDFDISAEIAALRQGDARVGAVVTFLGTVRDMNDGSAIQEMTLEHYPGMTEKALQEIIDQAKARWNIYQALVIHRVGPMKPEEQIVLVAVTSAHRGEAFAACEFIMDYLKTAAPFWKKEDTPEGGRWVDARVTDDAAMARWEKK